jgi:diaminopimelate epimerase
MRIDRSSLLNDPLLSFAKYHGAGNDFLLFDDRRYVFPIARTDWIAALCHRRFGVGADGVILLQPDFRMRIFNSDGTEASCCGNGIRCLTRFALDLGLAPRAIVTEDRIVPVELRGEEIAVAIGPPKEIRISVETERGAVHYVHLGVPHVVHFVPRAASVEIASLGPFFRSHPAFGVQGANVHFVERVSSELFQMRSFERGVEAETWACGTGACAAAEVAWTLYGAPSRIAATFPGGVIAVEKKQSMTWMIGPAVRVFHGSVSFPSG